MDAPNARGGFEAQALLPPARPSQGEALGAGGNGTQAARGDLLDAQAQRALPC